MGSACAAGGWWVNINEPPTHAVKIEIERSGESAFVGRRDGTGRWLAGETKTNQPLAPLPAPTVQQHTSSTTKLVQTYVLESKSQRYPPKKISFAATIMFVPDLPSRLEY